MLSLDAQRRLTEFLGECFHSSWMCGECPECGLCVEDESYHLDFSDWRVVGRLIEKLMQINLSAENGIGRAPIYWAWLQIGGRSHSGKGNTPQLAICLAIDAYLVAKGEYIHG